MKKTLIFALLLLVAVPTALAQDEIMVIFTNETGAYNITFEFNVSTYDPCRRSKETRNYAGIECSFEPVCPYDNPSYGHLRMECKFPINMSVDQVQPQLPVNMLDKYSGDIESLRTAKSSVENILNTERILMVVAVALTGVVYMFKERIKDKLIFRWWGK